MPTYDVIFTDDDGQELTTVLIGGTDPEDAATRARLAPDVEERIRDGYGHARVEPIDADKIEQWLRED